MEKEIIFLPATLAGHLGSMVEAASRLLHHNPNFTATFLLIPELLSSAINSSNLRISFQLLPYTDPPVPDPTETTSTFFSLLFHHYKPHIRDAVARRLSHGSPVAAVILDFFATTAIDIADEFGVPAYIYFASNATLLSLMLHLPTLDEEIPGDIGDAAEYIKLPGSPAIPPRAMPTSTISRKKQSYEWYLYHGRRFRRAKGVIANTFEELEAKALRAVVEGRVVPDGERTPAVYAVGPVVGRGCGADGRGERHECMEWLDGRPMKSVVVLCFGSMGSFTPAQAAELAAGIERSGHQFLWALSISNNPTIGTKLGMLPEGFLKRTKDRGLVWPGPVPQKEILSHPAVGGFVTHCGWNSVLESLWFGVPMLTWPLYAEQHLNAFQMVRSWGVAVELRVERDGGLVMAEEVEKGVRCLMEDGEGEGKKVREKVLEMMKASRRAVEFGGSSCIAMAQLAEELMMGSKICP